MTNDPRDALWEAAYRAYYDVYYSELLATTLVRRWQVLDDVTRVLVALTTSASAVAGWALWKEEGFRVIWSVLAGSGAVLAIVHATLSVPRRVKDWLDAETRARTLRIDLETVREKMRINPQFDIKAIEKSVMACRDKYRDMSRVPLHDLLLNSRLENKVQDALNARLADQTIP